MFLSPSRWQRGQRILRKLLATLKRPPPSEVKLMQDFACFRTPPLGLVEFCILPLGNINMSDLVLYSYSVIRNISHWH